MLARDKSDSEDSAGRGRDAAGGNKQMSGVTKQGVDDDLSAVTLARRLICGDSLTRGTFGSGVR